MLPTLLLLGAARSANARATIDVETRVPLARTTRALTSVSIDVCALKQGLDLADPALVAFARALAPGVVRIGGTDGNDLLYDMNSTRPMDTCACGTNCTLTAPAWRSVLDFAARTGLSLLFGLNPNADSLRGAVDLIEHTATLDVDGLHPLGYAYGNEGGGDATTARAYLDRLTTVRAAIDRAYAGRRISRATSISRAISGVEGRPSHTPLLVGPDAAVGPRNESSPSDLAHDGKIRANLKWLRTFVSTCHAVLDGVTWHTYDLRPREVRSRMEIGASRIHLVHIAPLTSPRSYLGAYPAHISRISPIADRHLRPPPTAVPAARRQREPNVERRVLGRRGDARGQRERYRRAGRHGMGRDHAGSRFDLGDYLGEYRRRRRSCAVACG